jgi:CBS domain-containing protein
MVDRQISAAIVTKSGRLAGIVTVSDVCRALAALLDQYYGENSPDDVA